MSGAYIMKLISEDQIVDGTAPLSEGTLTTLQNWLGKFGAAAKSAFQGAKIFFKKIGKRFFPIYETQSEQGVLNPSSAKPIINWTKPNKGKSGMTHMTMFLHTGNLGGGTVAEPVAKEPAYATMPESFFGKMAKDILLSEASVQQDYVDKLDLKASSIRPNLKNIEEFDDALEKIDTADVMKEDLYDIFEQAITALKFRTSFDHAIPSIAIFGPPGTAKTALTKEFAKQHKFNLKRIEIAGVYKEVLGGFPMKTTDPETGEERMGLQAVDIFPPSEDVSHSWILFFDEFNKDSDKMNAAMNVILTGEIGSHYRLPLKTIVIMAGNLGVADNTTVSSMDSAVYDRFSRKVTLNYDALAQLDYQERGTNDEELGDAFNFDAEKAKSASKKGVENFSTGLTKFSPEEAAALNKGADVKFRYNLVSSLRLYLANVTKENGGRYGDWALDPKNQLTQQTQNDEGGKAGYITLRTWTKIGEQLKNAAVTDWMNHKLKNKPLPGNHDVQFYEAGWKGAGFSGPVEYYLEVNQWNKRYIPEVLRTMLGTNPTTIITDIQTFTADEKKKLKSLSVPELLTGFKWRAKAFSKETIATELQYLVEQLPMQAAFEFQNITSEAELKSYIAANNKDYKPTTLKIDGEDKQLKTFKEYFTDVGDNDPVHLVAFHIISFFFAINLPQDSAGALIKKLNEVGKGEFMTDGKDGKGEAAAATPNKVANDLVSALVHFDTGSKPNPFKKGLKSIIGGDVDKPEANESNPKSGLILSESNIFGKMFKELGN
jgi:hypothetical protein